MGIDVAPVREAPNWYDTLVLRELLTGVISDDPLPLAEEVRVLTENWAAIEDALSVPSVARTEEKLRELLDARARRMFPRAYP
jgi:hypothetical protein